jgi:hypothetical protein
LKQVGQYLGADALAHAVSSSHEAGPSVRFKTLLSESENTLIKDKIAHLFIRQFGEDEGHVGMAKVILQRLPAHALRLFQAEAQQVPVLLESDIPEIGILSLPFLTDA